eukprot:3861145-Amphidinium_carterae.2
MCDKYWGKRVEDICIKLLGMCEEMRDLMDAISHLKFLHHAEQSEKSLGGAAKPLNQWRRNRSGRSVGAGADSPGYGSAGGTRRLPSFLVGSMPAWTGCRIPKVEDSLRGQGRDDVEIQGASHDYRGTAGLAQSDQPTVFHMARRARLQSHPCSEGLNSSETSVAPKSDSKESQRLSSNL